MEAHRPEPEESWQDRQFDEQDRQVNEWFLAFLEYIQKSKKDGEIITDNEVFVKGFFNELKEKLR